MRKRHTRVCAWHYEYGREDHAAIEKLKENRESINWCVAYRLKASGFIFMNEWLARFATHSKINKEKFAPVIFSAYMFQWGKQSCQITQPVEWHNFLSGNVSPKKSFCSFAIFFLYISKVNSWWSWYERTLALMITRTSLSLRRDLPLTLIFKEALVQRNKTGLHLKFITKSKIMVLYGL